MKHHISYLRIRGFQLISPKSLIVSLCLPTETLKNLTQTPSTKKWVSVLMVMLSVWGPHFVLDQRKVEKIQLEKILILVFKTPVSQINLLELFKYHSSLLCWSSYFFKRIIIDINYLQQLVTVKALIALNHC